MFDQSLFGPSLPKDAQVIFVADLFQSDYVGGAELTTEAIIEASPYKVFKVRSKDVTLQLLKQGQDKFWIFGNFASLNGGLIPTIVANMQYAILEYDYKYCKFRSPDKHAAAEGTCDCDNNQVGKLISSFLLGAEALFWMSAAQQNHYTQKFPFLNDVDQVVLSSVFDDKFFQKISQLRTNVQKSKWIILGSNSWVKGFDDAKKYCETNSLDFETVWNLPYEDVLKKLASAKGFVYLPAGDDTCPRMVIEAKLLGCELVTNSHVQHATEAWFDTKDLSDIENYLRDRRKVFWDKISKKIEKAQTISGYTTVYNCISQKYPFLQSIQSLLGFCDEVVVVDGGSTDGTWETLKNLSQQESRLVVKQIIRDWSHPRFAVFDGMQKAEARKLCSGDFCWQQDSDEIVHENDYSKIRNLVKHFPKGVNLLSLPVIEYWGGFDKVRMDVTPWKWRLSKNVSSITHGIPTQLRKIDSEGHLFAQQGTDGCDLIDSITGDPIPFLGFYTDAAHAVRLEALRGNIQAKHEYETWFNSVIQEIPAVYHFSWFDIERKIYTYKNYWTKHWESLRGETYIDNSSTNMFFDLSWSEVTDNMIREKAKELSKIGGWIWHQKWKGQKTPWLIVVTNPPKIMLDYYVERKKDV